MFRGVQHINLDAKGRMAVPSRQRELLSVLGDGHIVLTVDTQTSCLTLYPLPEWERIERDVQALPALNPAVKRFQRLVLGYANLEQKEVNDRASGQQDGADTTEHPEQRLTPVRNFKSDAHHQRSISPRMK